MQDLNILFLQTDLVWENPVKNRALLHEKIARSFQGEDLIVLPETFTTGFPVDPAGFAEEEAKSETLAWMKQIAVTFQTAVTGSFLLKEGKHYHNSLIFMHSDGAYERYDKRHVFSMGGEHERIKAGEKIVITELKGWKIRPMVCYDLRFPVWSKNRYDKGEYQYDFAVYVANWPAVRAYPWKLLLKARAVENLAYVLGVNRIGKDGPGNNYSGDSQLIDFKGNVVAQCEEYAQCAVSASLSYEALKKFRKKFNVGPDWDSFEING